MGLIKIERKSLVIRVDFILLKPIDQKSALDSLNKKTNDLRFYIFK